MSKWSLTLSSHCLGEAEQGGLRDGVGGHPLREVLRPLVHVPGGAADVDDVAAAPFHHVRHNVFGEGEGRDEVHGQNLKEREKPLETR